MNTGGVLKPADVAFLEVEAASGSLSAAQILFTHMDDKDRATRDNETYLKLGLVLAESGGNAWAQMKVGYCYQFGVGTPVDYVQAAYFFGKAAEQGDSLSQCGLAWLLESGLGVPQDFERAYRLYITASEHGEALGLVGQSFLLMGGYGTRQNLAKAVKLLHEAAVSGEIGSGLAKARLSVHYELGLGMPQDAEAARVWWERARLNGDHSRDRAWYKGVAEDVMTSMRRKPSPFRCAAPFRSSFVRGRRSPSR